LKRSVKGNGLDPSGAARSAVSGRELAALLLLVLALVSICEARVHRPQSWADTQFAKAEAQRETLNGRAEQARTKREYQAVIASYRRIVLEAPTSSKADGSAFLVAQITAEMGRHFKDDLALYSAVREYKFLRREYPGSKHRIEALLAIGEIYKNDLRDESESQAAFQELIRRYPHSDLVKEAKAELAAGSPTDSATKNATTKSNNEDNDDNGDSSDQQADNISAQAGQPSTARNQTGAAAQLRNDSKNDSKNDAKLSNLEQPVRVKDVQYWSTPEYTRIAVDLDHDAQFSSQRIDNPERVYFDLKNAKLASHLMGQSFDVDDGLVRKVRVAQYKPGRARVVVETENHASYNASIMLNPPRLVIDVHGNEDHPVLSSAKTEASTARPASHVESRKGSDSGAAKPQVLVAAESTPDQPSAPSATTLGPKKVIVEADDDDTPSDAETSKPVSSTKTASIESSATRARRSRSSIASSRRLREAEPTSDGDRSLIRTLGLRIGKIVIDPGHGGHDTGTIGPNGLLEKDLVLDVSKRLGKLLESRLGAEVAFTRRDDTFIPLETRTSIANQEEADLFVSVHANSSHDPDARGVETYYLNFTSSPEALEVAARENAASDKSIHELQDLVKKIALKEKIEESREFASDVQQSLHTGLATKSPGMRDRGVKKAPFVVLIGANMPSILAEISFLSNPGDEKHLKSPDYRQRIAESLYRGISRYVNGLGGVKVASRIEKASAN
jgi:N-acetylmuramoyl-L-alanine amidase